MTITKELWATLPCGKEIFLYTLTNGSGAYVKLSNVGAGIVSNHFDIDRLLDIMKDYQPNIEFRTWCDEAEQRIVSTIEDAVNNFDQRWYHRIIGRNIFR